MDEQNSTRKPRLVIEEDRLLELLSQEPKVAFKALQNMVLGAAGMNPTLAASSLEDVNHVLEMFGFAYDRTSEWILDQRYVVPDYLNGVIQTAHTVTRLCPKNKRIARLAVDHLLIAAIYERNHAAVKVSEISKGSEDEPVDSSTRVPSPQLHRTRPEFAHLFLEFGTALSYLVVHAEEKTMLEGHADCTLYLERAVQAAGLTTVSANVVIVALKQTSSAIAELVSYMAIVNKLKSDESKNNAAVYGLATDGSTFHFFKLSSNGILTKSKPLEWKGGENADYQQIYSITRQIIPAARSPVQYKVVMRNFDSEDRAKDSNDLLNSLGGRDAENGDELEDLGT